MKISEKTTNGLTASLSTFSQVGRVVFGARGRRVATGSHTGVLKRRNATSRNTEKEGPQRVNGETESPQRVNGDTESHNALTEKRHTPSHSKVPSEKGVTSRYRGTAHPTAQKRNIPLKGLSHHIQRRGVSSAHYDPDLLMACRGGPCFAETNTTSSH